MSAQPRTRNQAHKAKIRDNLSMTNDSYNYPDPLPDPRTDDNLLGLKLWVIETVAIDVQLMMATMDAHIRYQLKLEREGIMFAAGPVFEVDAEIPSGGMIVIRAGSAEGARATADADPMHSSGARRYTLRKWIVNEGSFTVTVPFSGYHRSEIK